MMPEIKYPEMTKNISTPMNPPGMKNGQAWKRTTMPTATVLKPSMSAR